MSGLNAIFVAGGLVVVLIGENVCAMACDIFVQIQRTVNDCQRPATIFCV